MGARIRARRNVLGLGQRHIAERLNVSVRTVGAWERDETAVSASNLQALADYLQTSVPFLQGLEPEPELLQGPEARYLEETDRVAHAIFIGLSKQNLELRAGVAALSASVAALHGEIADLRGEVAVLRLGREATRRTPRT